MLPCTALPTSRGVSQAHNQPNLVPPLTTTAAVLSYRSELQRIAPDVEWLMTLYLHPDVTPDEIRKASKAGIRGARRCMYSRNGA